MKHKILILAVMTAISISAFAENKITFGQYNPKNFPSLKTILTACEYLNDGDIPEDTFTPPKNAIYISLKGDDNNPGTINKPFNSLLKGIIYANKNKNKPLTIYLREGEYLFKKPMNKEGTKFGNLARGNIYITGYKNERVIIKPSFYPNKPTSYSLARFMMIRGNYENITFDKLILKGWNVAFQLGCNPYKTGGSLKNIVIKNIFADNFIPRGKRKSGGTFLSTDQVQKNFYGKGKIIFKNPETAKYQIEGLILKNISVHDAICVVNIGDENDANVKGLRITNFGIYNKQSNSVNTAQDGWAIVNCNKVLFDHDFIDNIGGDGIDTKSYNVSVVNCHVRHTNRNAVKMWRGGEIINSIIDSSTIINDAAIVSGHEKYRIINSIIYHKPKGYCGIYSYKGNSDKQVEIVNSIFMDLKHTFYSGSPNLISLNSNYYKMPDGLFSGKFKIANIEELNKKTGSKGNIAKDPMFKDAPKGDFHLLKGSPCIKAGTNDKKILLPTFDFDGNKRSKTTPSIGPFEYK